jgi:hypothetical protein
MSLSWVLELLILSQRQDDRVLPVSVTNGIETIEMTLAPLSESKSLTFCGELGRRH